MEITIPEITFTIPNIDPTTAIIIIFVLLVFLVYWHYTLYPLLKKKRDHKRIRSATKSKTFKRKNRILSLISPIRKAVIQIMHKPVGTS